MFLVLLNQLLISLIVLSYSPLFLLLWYWSKIQQNPSSPTDKAPTEPLLFIHSHWLHFPGSHTSSYDITVVLSHLCLVTSHFGHVNQALQLYLFSFLALRQTGSKIYLKAIMPIFTTVRSFSQTSWDYLID